MSNDPKNMSDDELLNMIRKAFDALGDIDKQNAVADEYKRKVSRRDWFEPECKMCGKDKPLNYEGYCSTCWTVWNS